MTADRRPSGDPIEVLLLSRQDLGESDRILRLLTADGVQVSAVARGARASRRRFGGALEPGTRLWVGLRKGRGDLGWVQSADVLSSPLRARSDYGRLLLLGHGCEVAQALTSEAPEVRIFQLLGVWLALLEDHAGVGRCARLAFEAKALTFVGLCPQLVACARCGEPVSGRVHFDADSGGALHPACGDGVAVDASELAGLERLRRTPLRDICEGPVAGAAAWLLCDFITHHLRRKLSARAMLAEEGL